jgi:hypothetical protein
MHQPGIEPGSVPWQGTILPLDHWCLRVFVLRESLQYRTVTHCPIPGSGIWTRAVCPPPNEPVKHRRPVRWPCPLARFAGPQPPPPSPMVVALACEPWWRWRTPPPRRRRRTWRLPPLGGPEVVLHRWRGARCSRCRRQNIIPTRRSSPPTCSRRSPRPNTEVITAYCRHRHLHRSFHILLVIHAVAASSSFATCLVRSGQSTQAANGGTHDGQIPVVDALKQDTSVSRCLYVPSWICSRLGCKCSPHSNPSV